MQEGTLDMLIFGCRFAPRCQLGVPWHHHEAASACTEWAVRGCRAPPECAIQSRIVPCASGRTRCRGAGSRAGEVCHPAERQSVGAEADAKGSLLLAPATFPSSRAWREAAHREGGASGWCGAPRERLEGRRRFIRRRHRRDVVFPLSCPVDRSRVLLLWGRSTTLGQSP